MTTLPELEYNGHLMKVEPFNLSMAQIVRAILDREPSIRVVLEPGDISAYVLELLILRDETIAVCYKDKIVRIDLARNIRPHMFFHLSANEWTHTILSWWFNCLKLALLEAQNAK